MKKKRKKKSKDKLKKRGGEGKKDNKHIKKREMELLIENFLLIQKTLTEIISSFKQLEKRFDKFLKLVEKAARTQESEEKTIKGSEGKKKDLAEKIDLLIEQNKTIGEGMMLLEKFIKEKLEELETNR